MQGKHLVFQGRVEGELRYDRGEPLSEGNPLLMLQLRPKDSQIGALLNALDFLNAAPEDSRVIIPTNLKEGEIQIAFPRDGWGYIAIERGGILIGLHDVFLRQLIAFLSRYQAEGSAWPPYAEFDLINPSNGQEGPSTTLEVRVTKSGTQRLGDLSEMFD